MAIILSSMPYLLCENRMWRQLQAKFLLEVRFKESLFFHTFKFSNPLLLLLFPAAERFSTDFLLGGKFHLNVERRNVRMGSQCQIKEVSCQYYTCGREGTQFFISSSSSRDTVSSSIIPKLWEFPCGIMKDNTSLTNLSSAWKPLDLSIVWSQPCDTNSVTFW